MQATGETKNIIGDYTQKQLQRFNFSFDSVDHNLLTFFISFTIVTCRPNSHRSTPNLRAQFRTLERIKFKCSNAFNVCGDAWLSSNR